MSSNLHALSHTTGQTTVELPTQNGNSHKWKSIHTAATVSLPLLVLLYITTEEQQSQSTKPITTRGKKFSQKKTKGFVDGLSHSTPQKKAKKQGEMPLPSLGSIPFKKM